jgi:hypothetical protein
MNVACFASTAIFQDRPFGSSSDHSCLINTLRAPFDIISVFLITCCPSHGRIRTYRPSRSATCLSPYEAEVVCVYHCTIVLQYFLILLLSKDVITFDYSMLLSQSMKGSRIPECDLVALNLNPCIGLCPMRKKARPDQTAQINRKQTTVTCPS